jgi:hypothetical protein
MTDQPTDRVQAVADRIGPYLPASYRRDEVVAVADEAVTAYEQWVLGHQPAAETVAVLDRSSHDHRVRYLLGALAAVTTRAEQAEQGRDRFKAKFEFAWGDGDAQALQRIHLHGQIDALTAELDDVLGRLSEADALADRLRAERDVTLSERDEVVRQIRRVRELAVQAEPKHDQYEFAQAVLAALDGAGKGG